MFHWNPKTDKYLSNNNSCVIDNNCVKYHSHPSYPSKVIVLKQIIAIPKVWPWPLLFYLSQSHDRSTINYCFKYHPDPTWEKGVVSLIVSKEVLWSVRGSYQTIRGPPLPNVTRHSGWWPSTVTPSIDQALHQFLTLLLIWTLLPNLTFYLIARGFHRTFATGAVCQQRTLIPPDTWSCPTLGLASVLMLRPISSELALFPDFWVSNIARYFCFFFLLWVCVNCVLGDMTLCHGHDTSLDTRQIML